MIYIVYSSIASYPLSRMELEALLLQSRSNNKKVGLTGLLLYHDQRFMQLIEGEEADVRQCYSKIIQDPRHEKVLKLVEKSLRVPYFRDWTMAFENIDPALAQDEGFSSFLSTPYSVTDLGLDIHEGLFLLLSFKKQVIRDYWRLHAQP